MELLISSMRFSAAYDYPFYDCSSLHNYILHLTLQYISIQETSTVSDHIHFFVPPNMYDDVAVRKIFNFERSSQSTKSATRYPKCSMPAQPYCAYSTFDK